MTALAVLEPGISTRVASDGSTVTSSSFVIESFHTVKRSATGASPSTISRWIRIAEGAAKGDMISPESFTDCECPSSKMNSNDGSNCIRVRPSAGPCVRARSMVASTSCEAPGVNANVPGVTWVQLQSAEIRLTVIGRDVAFVTTIEWRKT